jgi:hypothetical protein
VDFEAVPDVGALLGDAGAARVVSRFGGAFRIDADRR